MSLRTIRQDLVAQTDLRGDAFCRTYSTAADQWLTSLFAEATGGDDRGLALVAVGGYGRGELCPYSDLDVVLIHKGRRDVASIADRLWYPIWDQGIALDHSVRRSNEVLEMAGQDMKVALGLLTARVVCGQSKVAEPTIEEARERWIGQRPLWLDPLALQVAERHLSFGDLGFLLEPDVKESRGGLRDIAALEALLLAVPSLADTVDTRVLQRAHDVLIAVRVELQRNAGRQLNKVLLQDQEQTAVATGYEDADALMRALASAGRTVAWESDDAWRQRGIFVRTFPGRRRSVPSNTEPARAVDGEPGITVTSTEVSLGAQADVDNDPSLALRLAAVAAERGLPIARSALDTLGRRTPPCPDPWPTDVRRQLVRVLATGPAAVAALEALDQRHLLERFLPEWGAVRNKPQRNPYHVYTVDRHLLEATANAATLTHRVSRPDLLLLGTLLHDIGKGFPGDHTEVGMEIVANIGGRMGLDDADVATLVDLVRLHLILPDTATRRDLDDPATAQRVAKEVGSRTTLDLLAALVEADSLATGPSAWGSWKAGLVADLVDRSRRLLAGEAPPPPSPVITEELAVVMETVRSHGVPALSIDDPLITVVAPDRPGLLADVTGVLALHGLDVRSAVVAGDDGVAVEIFTGEPALGRWPSAARLSDDLAGAMKGTLPLEQRIAERAKTYKNASRAVPHLPIVPQVTVDNNASETATVIEVRVEDVIGQLHRITRALGACGLDVISAKASTFGAMAVDAFYVRSAQGDKIYDSEAIGAIERAVLEGVASG